MNINIFTEREKQILSLLREGKTYNDISDSLGITHRTVRFHIDNMKEKTGSKNMIELVAKYSS